MKHIVCLMVCFGSLGCSTDTFIGLTDDSGLGDSAVTPDGGSDGGDGGSDAKTDVVDPPGDSGDAGVADGFDGYVPPTSRRVFISSGHWTANFGGASGADALCASAASAAGLSGTWAAWLSSGSSSPATRFTHSTVPWKLLDGTVVASDWTSLTSGTLSNPINRDEHNSFVGFTGDLAGTSWTSTFWDGTSMLLHGQSEDCSSFTSADPDGGVSAYALAGYNNMTSSKWTIAENDECFYSLSLYCFEQ